VFWHLSRFPEFFRPLFVLGQVVRIVSFSRIASARTAIAAAGWLATTEPLLLEGLAHSAWLEPPPLFSPARRFRVPGTRCGKAQSCGPADRSSRLLLEGPLPIFFRFLPLMTPLRSALLDDDRARDAAMWRQVWPDSRIGGFAARPRRR